MVLLTEQIIGEQAGFEYWGDYPFLYGWEYPFFMTRNTHSHFPFSIFHFCPALCAGTQRLLTMTNDK
jgi:hypothetical protein